MKEYNFLLLTVILNSCPDRDIKWNFDRLKGFPRLHIKKPVISKGWEEAVYEITSLSIPVSLIWDKSQKKPFRWNYVY